MLLRVPSTTVDSEFQQLVLKEVNAQMGAAYSYNDDPIVDVSFGDDL